MLQLLAKLRTTINQAVEYFTILLVITMVVIVAAQVFYRFVLSNSLGWSEELARFLFIWIIFLGSEIGLRKKAHIAVDSVLRMLKGVPQLLLSLFIDVIIMVFAIIVFLSGLELVQGTMNRPSVSLNLPMGWVYISIPIAMALILMNTLRTVFKKLSTKSIEQPE
ncbi:TRAP transporter small permease [Alteribacillus sp. YIM 98480]|uniref:TRAP transporter small permease n=1 Tax=Alteribacillus sp. YIM 98480 TaxID=2606599 RepID=UPI00131E444E|nr:TRAP transporter small permease [Alteribacillus sp. YIM 98480]